MSTEFRPLIEVLRELKALALKKASGFLFVVTEENHSCIIRINAGQIEEVVFRMLRNDEAVQRLTMVGAAKALSRRLGLSVELDPLAPVVPPGAMFMARPEALRTLSEGAKELVRLTDQAAAGAEQSAERLRRARAAEVLELLTVYAAMSSGFHPREVLTPAWAGRLYGALAYKHRVVTADLPAHADEQVRFLQARFGPLAGVGARVRTYVDVHHPDMGSALKPAYRYLTGGASGLARAATSAGRRLRGVGRHREEDKGD